MFFYKEWKKMERTERSFIKNGKERKEPNVLLKRTDAQPCPYPSLQRALYCRITLPEVLHPEPWRAP